MNHKRNLILIVSILSIIIVITEAPLSSGDTQLTTDGKADRYPAITQTSDGKIWVVWHTARTGNNELFYKTHETSWSADTQLTTDPGVDATPSITQTIDGKIWVVWMSSRTGNYDIVYKTSVDSGSSWSPEKQLTNDTSADKHPTIIQASDQKIWIVWQSNRTGNDDIFYKFSADNGLSWSTDTPLTTHASDDREPSIIGASDGKIWVVWASLRTGNYDLFYKTYNGTSWSTDTPLTTDPNSDSNPSIAQTTDEAIWVVWESIRNGLQFDIYYKIYNGSSWSSENMLTWYMDMDITPAIFQAANQTIWLVWTSDKFDNFDIYYKFVNVDITIKSVTTSATSVPQGNPVNITVIVQNEGTAGANFTVTTYYNESIIKTETKTLIPSLFPFYIIHTWNTTSVTPGNYTITARVSPVQGETDTADNTYPNGVVMVTIPGDIDVDGDIDLEDLYIFSRAYGTNPPSNPKCDLDRDGDVDRDDLDIFGGNYGKTI